MVVFEGQYPRDTKRGYRVSPESSGDDIEAKRTEPLSRVWSGCLGSAIEAISLAPLGVSHVGSVVSISVVFERIRAAWRLSSLSRSRAATSSL